MHAVVLGASPVSGGWFDVAALKKRHSSRSHQMEAKGACAVDGARRCDEGTEGADYPRPRVEEAEALEGPRGGKKVRGWRCSRCRIEREANILLFCCSGSCVPAAAMVKKATTTEGFGPVLVRSPRACPQPKDEQWEANQRLVDVALTRLSDAPDGVEEVLRCARRAMSASLTLQARPKACPFIVSRKFQTSQICRQRRPDRRRGKLGFRTQRR